MRPAHGKRVVIVTGASRGLGREIALRFGRAGDKVVVNFLQNEERAIEAAEEIAHAGGEAFSFLADVRISAEVEAMVAATLRRWGAVDVLVNNAGLTKDGLLLRMADEAWNDVIAANLTGPFHCIRAAAGTMMKQRSGQILSIGSIVGLQGREGQANYSASKAGLMGLTRACAKELGPYNIKVNAVLPGYLPTDMGRKASDAVLERVRGENALGRPSGPAEVAEFVYRLSLMENVSGQMFNLDSRIL
jgi:3-oxoacyl-[acyl-carrier protein] reductase